MERKSIYNTEDILPKVIFTNPRSPKEREEAKIDLDGDKIKFNSLRLQTFKTKGLSCCVCGVTGSFFAKEKDPGANSYHLNLYAIKEGREILMTKDHITPSSRGGKDYLGNFQTMCSECNARKGNKEGYTMKPVDFVTIDELRTIYKQGVEANAIQVARVKDSENGECQFNIIVGKGLYQVGDRAIYCQPDYCVPPTNLFNEYYFPGGNETKSKLGKKGRIRAVKFNFSFEKESDPIYSNGILISMKNFNDYVVGKTVDAENLQEVLNIVKYVADESDDGSMKSGLAKGDIPYFLYKTDENRCELNKRVIDECFNDKEVLSFTQKRDGSSITLYYRIENGVEQFGICSREMEKKLDQTYVSAYKDGEFLLHRYFHKDTNVKGWYNDFTQKFYTDEEVAQFEKVMVESKDSFVDTTKKHEYLDKLIGYCKANDVQLALRGELVGSGNRGGGNKLNQDAKGDPKVIWFGVDIFFGVFQRLHYKDKHNLKEVCEALGLEYTQELFEGVFSYHEIIAKAHQYFIDVKEKTGQIVEGIVIRTKNSNRLSCKYINPEYDSKA